MWTNGLEIKISQIISDDNYLIVSKTKDELCEQTIEVNQITLARYLKKNYEHKLPIKDIMNLMDNRIDARMKWCQSYKNQNWDLVIFGNENVFSYFRKVKRNSTESGYIKSSKTCKGKQRVNVTVVKSRIEEKNQAKIIY